MGYNCVNTTNWNTIRFNTAKYYFEYFRTSTGTQIRKGPRGLDPYSFPPGDKSAPFLVKFVFVFFDKNLHITITNWKSIVIVKIRVISLPVLNLKNIIPSHVLSLDPCL